MKTLKKIRKNNKKNNTPDEKAKRRRGAKGKEREVIFRLKTISGKSKVRR